MMHDDRTLWRRLDGEMPEAEAQALDAEASRDPALARRLAELRGISAAARAGVPAPPPGFAARIAALAVAGPVAPVFQIDEARRFLRRVVAAAAVLAALGLAYLAVKVFPMIDTGIYADPLGK